MAASTLIATMFRRRLAILAVVFVAAFALPLIKLARLTTTRGEELRETAEANLVSKQLLPTGRGKILDRKGRVLAVDRPSYDVAVDYSVITGQWAYSEAARQARRANKNTWKQLSPIQRDELVQTLLPEYRRRLDEGWRAFASISNVPLSDIEDRKSAVVAEVSRQAATVWERQRLARETELSRGRDLATEISISEVDSKPIREQTQPHVLLNNIDDRTAFALRQIMPAARAAGSAGSAPHSSGMSVSAGVGGLSGSAPMAAGAPSRSGFETDASDPASGQRVVLPGLRIIDGSGREYPFDEVNISIDRSSFPGPIRSGTPKEVLVRGLGVHVVGWMRGRLYKEDLAARPRLASDGTPDLGFYAEGDSIGASGIEASAERELRGLRGQITERLDTGEVQTVERVAGKDVSLTIDAMLQARVQALLDPAVGLAVVQPWQRNKAAPAGTPLKAAAVVLDIDSGDILAMVSTPTFTRQQLREDPDSVFKDTANLPLLNRAIARPYPPGSIVKPLMYAAAVTDGVIEYDRTIACNGHLNPDQPKTFRCWVFKPPLNTTHAAQFGHPLNAAEALMVSCNIYFYTVGRTIGPERITKWYELFGCGPNALHPRLGVGDYYAGAAGATVRPIASDDDEMLGTDLARSPLHASAAGRKGVSPGEATLMGIGQGPVAWTPLHAADAFATLARGGVRIVPRLRMDDELTTVDLQLDRRAVAVALEGLHRAVADELGSGHHITIDAGPGVRGGRELIFNLPNVAIWGKSGTADSGQLARDSNGDLVRDAAGNTVSLDHSWFVVLVAPGDSARPKLAVALVVENGGSGGKVAGPLCNQLLRALAAEGYLERAD